MISTPERISAPNCSSMCGTVTELQKIIKTYKNAKTAFEACPDSTRSDPVPPESQRIINFFFAARERLMQIALVSDNKLAFSWAQACLAAEECPELLNDGKTGEASYRMQVLNAAEAALLGDDGDQSND
jgi:hypothetical protein